MYIYIQEPCIDFYNFMILWQCKPPSDSDRFTAINPLPRAITITYIMDMIAWQKLNPSKNSRYAVNCTLLNPYTHACTCTST